MRELLEEASAPYQGARVPIITVARAEKTAEDAAAREAEEKRGAEGYRQANHYGWGGPGDGSRSRDEMRALETLEVEADAPFESIKAAWRRLAKANHPDAAPGDSDAAKRFQAVHGLPETGEVTASLLVALRAAL